MIKIAYCVPQLWVAGGVERIITDKANWLADNGYDVTLVTTEQESKPVFYPLDERIKHIDLSINYNRSKNYSYLKRKFVTYKNKKKHKEKMQKVLFQNKFDIVLTVQVGAVDVLYKIKDTSKKILEFHIAYDMPPTSNKLIDKLKNKYLRYRQKKFGKKYNNLICLTKRDAEARGFSNKTEIIPNFVPTNDIEFSNLENKNIIAVGRLTYQKGFDRLVFIWKNVCKHFPEWKLRIFGDGEDFDYLNKMIQENNLTESIEILKPTKTIFEEYSKSSIFVSTSRFEGLPMVMLEALAVGLPIISYDYPCGPSDVIEDGQNGFLIKDGDSLEFENKLIELIKNESLRKRMGKGSLVKSNFFKQDEIMLKWDNIFKSIAKNGK